jgi:predicted metalloprotease with PDZ domain
MIGWGFETIYGGYRTVTSDGLQVELVYGGIDHNVISVLYREYGRTSDGWFVRPGYSQDLRYDLNVAKSIAFREVRITVENADQESITFTVTKSPVVPSDTLIHISGRAQSDQVGTSRAGFEFDRTGTVTRVVKNSPADSAGVAVDDEIFEINSERFPEGDIAAALKILESPGRNWIRLFVWRGQYKTQLEVRKP